MPEVGRGWLVSLCVSGLLSTALPFVAIVVAKRKLGGSYRPVLFGALVFALSQVATRVPLVAVAESATADARTASIVLQWLWLAALSWSAGLFEEVGRYVGYRTALRDRLTYDDAILYGLGHGGLEALLFGGLASLATVYGLITLNETSFALLPAEVREVARTQLEAIAAQSAWVPLLGFVERCAAMTAHVAFSLIVLRAARERRPRFVVLSIALHGAINFGALAILQWLGSGAIGAAVTEVAIAALAIGYLQLARRIAGGDVPAIAEPVAASA